MENGSPALEVGLDIVTGGSMGEIAQLKRAMGEAEGQIVRQAGNIEGAVGGMVDTKPAIAEFKAFAASASQSTSAIERSAERMAFALKREIDTFGMSKTEMRNWRLEQKALAAESRDLTEVAVRLRAVGAEMDRLEAKAAGAANGVRKTGGAMAAMAPQAQDLFTQISMGGNIINAFVIQAGQMSSQLVYMEGAAGKVGAFMMGPWGLALTAGALVVGALSDKLFGNAEASKKAEDGMKKFQDRQSDIGSFIDMTTGRLTEQNRILILNATLTRQKGIADNEASIRDARKNAFRIAGNTQLANAPMVATGTSGIVTTQRMTDPAVQAAIRAANGDVGKLVDSINRLSKTRPDLGPLALQLTSVAGSAITASRENENLRKELRGLSGDTTAYGKASATAIERQVALATARTPLARARAQLDLVKAGADAAEKQGGAALKAYEADLTRTTRAVQAAEAAERAAAQGASRARTAASAARREALKGVRDQIKGEEDLRKWVAKGFDSPQFTVIGNVEAAKRAAEQMRTVFKAEFGDADLLGDQVGTYNDGQAAKWGKASDALQEYNDALDWTVERLDLIAQNTANAGRGMADAFGEAGRALGDLAAIYTGFEAHRARLDADRQRRILDANGNERTIARANERFALQSASAQIGAFGDMASAAKGFFNEKSKGYAIITGAEKAFRAVEFALSVRAIAQDAVETGSSIAKSVARTAVSATEAVVNAIKSLPFPLNLAAGAATVAAIASLGVSIAGGFGGGGNKLPAANTGSGTVLGDRDAKSESVKRAIDGLRDIDTLMLSSSREMAATLRSIDGQIGGVAALVVRAGNIDASAGVTEGFKTNAIGSVLKAVVPIFGGALASLFGSKTTVVGSGLYGGAQTLGSVLNGGFDASYYSDVEKKKKFFGITTGTSYSTQYTGADAGLENQFTLILRNFNSAIVAAAGPLGESTDAIQNRLNGFVVNLGKIDFKGLTGVEIQEKLTAVFGAAADNMASSAFPGFERFQKVGEGMFETLVRVSSTVEAVSASLDLLGTASQKMGIDAKVGLADRFESVSALTSAADAYFQAFYTKEEQATAKTARFARVFDSLGMAMPATLDGFRKLVEAQDLTTAAGQSAYATLLQLAPAFADLKSAMDGAKSAADILAERQDLQRKVLELNGDTAAIRALDLAKVDVSNRALQEQVWAIEDAQKAAQAAEQLASAWSSVGDSINDEIKRIRGLDASGGNSFAMLQGQFNAATTAARGGDMDAAKLLPSLSQALLKTAGDVATSRQELDRVQSQTAASLEATSAVIAALSKGNPLSATNAVAAAGAAAQASAPVSTSSAADQQATIQGLRDDMAKMRADMTAGLASIASNTGRSARVLEDVTAASGGNAVTVANAA